MFVRIWAFRPAADREGEFERAYGPTGPWAGLFSRAEGYLGTRLLRGPGPPTRYVTIDFWTSQAAWQAFLGEWGTEYDAVDLQCRALNSREQRIGDFVVDE
jgi:heme-degrading monooxygenase HmoA